MMAFLVACLLVVGGCALGTSKVDVSPSPDPLLQVPDKKKGEILVNQFVDSRQPHQQKYIGYKRNWFGMPIGHVGLPEGVKLEPMVTKYFAQALQKAGYNIVISDPASQAPGKVKFDAVIEGEITQFWFDGYVNDLAKVDVKIAAIDPTSKRKLWEKPIHGEKTDTSMWARTDSLYERLLKEALTIALNKAAQEFASEEFYSAIKKK